MDQLKSVITHICVLNFDLIGTELWRIGYSSQTHEHNWLSEYMVHVADILLPVPNKEPDK